MKPYTPSLPPKKPREFAEGYNAHPEFRSVIIGNLNKIQDDAADCAWRVSDETAYVVSNALVEHLQKEIAALHKTSKENSWTAEDALRCMEQLLERFDPSQAENEATGSPKVQAAIKDVRNNAWDQAASAVMIAQDTIESRTSEDDVSTCSMGRIWERISEEYRQMTPTDEHRLACELKEAIPYLHFWHVLARMSVA